MSFEDYLANQDGGLVDDNDDVVDTQHESGAPDVDALQRRLQELEERALRAEGRLEEIRRVEAPRGREAPPPEPEVQFTQDDFIDDPEQFTRKLNQYVQQKARPLMEQLIRVQARQEMNDAVERHPYLRDYEQEATEMLRNATPAELTNPKTWDMVALMIKERHFDDIRARSSKKPSPPDTNRSRSSSSDGRSKMTLTPEEKYHARMIGVSEEDYIKSKEAMYGG